MITECLQKAEELLLGNATSRGVIAGRQYYPDVWGRDALITSLGMSCSGNRKLVSLSELTINQVSRFQKENGQLPNKFDTKGRRLDFGEGGCVDTSLWYPIAVLNHYLCTGDRTFLRKHSEPCNRALEWASCLDLNNDFLLETPDGADWMDLLFRSGRVLYDNVLFYAGLKACDRILSELKLKTRFVNLKEKVKKSINLLLWPSTENQKKVNRLWGHTGIEKDLETALWDGEKPYYLAELGLRKFDPRCDAYANTLAMFFGIPEKKKTKSILEHIKKEGIDKPYPIKVLWPPIGDETFRPFYFRWTQYPRLQAPGSYHNGGIWPMAGGFYVSVLKNQGLDWKFSLRQLARANSLGAIKEWEFNEWLDCYGNPGGSFGQSWSAGMFIYAYQCCKNKTPNLF